MRFLRLNVTKDNTIFMEHSSWESGIPEIKAVEAVEAVPGKRKTITKAAVKAIKAVEAVEGRPAVGGKEIWARLSDAEMRTVLLNNKLIRKAHRKLKDDLLSDHPPSVDEVKNKLFKA